MQSFAEALKAHICNHPFDSGSYHSATVLDQLYQVYTESRKSAPQEIRNGFRELERFLESLSLNDNNAIFALCFRLYTAYKRRPFIDGMQYGAHFILKLYHEKSKCTLT